MQRFKIMLAGEEQMPSDEAKCAQVEALWESNGLKMNELFKKYFGLDPSDRYMGSFPYPDKDTGQCRVMWALSMSSSYIRNLIVSCLRAAILDAELEDIIITKEDEDPDPGYRSRWPASMDIIAMGPSITDTLVGELRIQEALASLEAWFSD